MLNLCLEMKVLKYGFVGLLLLAATLFIIHPTQNQVFGQGANTTNTTDVERPTAEGLNPGFVPDSEDGASPPPPPANAVTVDKLPKENPIKDPDSDPLSITNRTEILQILPANDTKIIKHVDEDLKNSTGVGLAPSDVLEKITSEKSNDNKSILQLASPVDIKKIESEDSAIANATGGQGEEDEPVTNATSEKAQVGEQANATATNATNATSGEQPSQTREKQKLKGGEETNLTNATSGEQPSQTREKQKQAEEGGEQAKTGAEKALVGGEATNATNATSGEQPSQTREKQKQAEEGGEQAKTGAEKALVGGEATNATNATSGEQKQSKGGEETTSTIFGKHKQSKGGEETTSTFFGKQKKTGGEEASSPANDKPAETPGESLNNTNVTSMLNTTDSKDGNDNPKDGG